MGKSDPPPGGHLAMSGDSLGCHNWWRCYWHLVGVEARDPVKHLTCPGQTPRQRMTQPQNASGAEVKKSCSSNFDTCSSLTLMGLSRWYVSFHYFIILYIMHVYNCVRSFL